MGLCSIIILYIIIKV